MHVLFFVFIFVGKIKSRLAEKREFYFHADVTRLHDLRKNVVITSVVVTVTVRHVMKV